MANPSGDKLKKIQEMLNKMVNPKPPLEVDGKWGKKTSAAIKLLQAKAKIPTTGEVDSATGLVLARVFKTGKIEKEQPVLFVQDRGKTIGYTQKEYNKAKKSIIEGMRKGPLFKMKIASQSAQSLWKHFDSLNRDQWFVSWCIEVYSSADLPPKSQIDNAIKTTKKMESYLKSGNISKFLAEQVAAERTTNQMLAKMRKYQEAMISGGDGLVEDLEWTKTLSFTFVGVFAAPVTASVLGTGALASAIVGGAAVAAAESAASEIGKGSAGVKDWTPGGAVKNVIVDAGVGGIVGIFNKGGSGGKHVFDATITKIAPKLAAEKGFKTLSKETVGRLAVYLVTEGAKSTTEGAIKDTAISIKDKKKMTLEKFTTNLALNFVKGVSLGPLSGVIGKYASGTIDKKFKSKIWDIALKEMSKSSKGTIHIDAINKRTIELVEKMIGDMIKADQNLAVDNALKKSKGPISTKAFEKHMEAFLFSNQRLKTYSAIAAKMAQKSLKNK